VRLKEKAEQMKDKLRDTELEVEEAEVPRVPAKVYTPSADSSSISELVPDLR